MTTTAKTERIKRSQLAGLLLRPLGHGYWGVEHTDDGFSLLGKGGKQIHFSDLAALPTTKKVLGFQSATFPLKNGSEMSVIGVGRDDAARFTNAAHDTIQRYFGEKIDRVGDDLLTLAKAIERLENPRRYPSACLLQPFFERASKIMEELPAVIPDNAVADEKRQLLDKVIAFQENAQSMRKDAAERFVATELDEMKEFFDGIESNPLTPEQRLAVVSDEDATLVLAGAGSGKTSVIVAKAAYLIKRDIRQPDEILLMAFGKDAAAEMASRIKERSGANVDALTFHALGYDIIREVEGGAPALAAHASDDAQFRALLRDILLTDVAKLGGMKDLMLEWFSEFFWPFKSEWDFKTKGEYYQYVEAHELRTLQGDRVKSFEELQIANWLYLNGIAYEYEPTYEHDLPENTRRTYTPDFRLSESGVYIEHFGVRKAKAPDGIERLVTAPHIDRQRYLEDMAWKRKVHDENDTVLVETFSYEQVEGRLTEALAEKITPYVTLKPVPQDQVFDVLSELGQLDAFTGTLATFLRHFKSSGATLKRCQDRSETSDDQHRSKAFLKIFEPLIEAYEKRLDDRIDFEDMIIRAAEHVETGRYKSPYRHLLVDEFQDISAGRARLLKALKAQHEDARLFAVGDDWQSIYRFTGSDIHLMRDFGEEFGGHSADERGVHRVVDLGRTFRSVDKIALPARHFVLQNPSQIEKTVITAAETDEPAIMLRHYAYGQHDAALKQSLEQIASKATNKTSVLLLGRYHFLRPKGLSALQRSYPKLTIKFMTVHASKGLEADHVIILRAEADTMGFPSQIVDDPLLDLVLPKPESFEHAEERRLFYVALTRARKTVTILADREKPSAFARELIEEPKYEVLQLDDAGIADHQCRSCGGRMLAKSTKKGRTYFTCEHGYLCGETLSPCSVCGEDLPQESKTNPNELTCSCGATFPACPECDDGWLIERRGKYGKFLSCVRYPACTGKGKVSKSGKKDQRIRAGSRR